MQLNSFTDVEIYLFQLTIGNSYVVLLFETSNKLQHEHFVFYLFDSLSFDRLTIYHLTVCCLTIGRIFDRLSFDCLSFDHLSFDPLCESYKSKLVTGCRLS